MPDDWRKRYMSDGEGYEGMPDTEEMFVLWDNASAGIDDGDLMPLAAYLRAGGVISGFLAKELARFIEQPTGSGVRKRGPSEVAQAKKRVRRLQVGAVAFVRIRRSPRAHQARIFDDIAKNHRFKVGQVAAAYKEFRSLWIASDGRYTLELLPLWRNALLEYCQERGLSFDEEAFGIIEGEN